MVKIQALAGLLEAVIGQPPDPYRPVGDHQGAGGLAQAAPQGLRMQLFPQSINARAGRDKALLIDHGPSATAVRSR